MTRSPHARWWAMGATALTLLVVGLDMTVLNVALPTIAVDLQASSSQLQWFVDAYTLVMSAMLLPAGMLGDRYGRKRLTLASLVVFGTGSLWCAYAGSAASLIAARALLGLGSAVLIPLAMSAAVVLFEPEERPRAVMVLGLSTMVGLPLGPILAGVLLEHFWWGSVFIVNVPIVVAAILAGHFLVPTSRNPEQPKLDLVGAGLSIVGLGALVTANQADPLATITRLDPVYVDIQQSAADLLQLRQALSQGGAVPTSAQVRLKLPDGSDYGFTGTVEFSEVIVDQSTGTVTIRARFANPQAILLPGMYVTASFAQAVQTSAILVPQQAVSRNPQGGATVFVVGPGNRAVQRTIIADRTIGASWVVTGGLAPGEKVITQGTANLKDGAQIKPVPAGAPQKIGTRGQGANNRRQSR